MRRFGELRTYKDGETLFETGKPGPGMFVVLSGHVAITQRDGLGHVTPIIDQGPGQFLAEIGQLSGRVALVDGHAEGDVETLLIPPEQLRALLVAEADLGERIMRALILRRVSLIQGGVGGPVLIGPRDSGDVVAAAEFPGPQRPSASSARSRDRHGRRRSDRALFALADRSAAGGLPRRHRAAQSERNRAGARDRHDRRPRHRTSSTTSRWSAAVRPGLRPRSMRRPKGLSVAVLDARAFGGQAGASARIENYLGFPTGISGQALAGARLQPGAEIRRRDADPGRGQVARLLARRRRLRARDSNAARRCARRSIVVASGARYRRPGDRKPRRLRGPRRLVLGLADRGAAVRRPGGRAGRRRQFGGAGRGVPVRPCAQGAT